MATERKFFRINKPIDLKEYSSDEDVARVEPTPPRKFFSRSSANSKPPKQTEPPKPKFHPVTIEPTLHKTNLGNPEQIAPPDRSVSNLTDLHSESERMLLSEVTKVRDLRAEELEQLQNRLREVKIEHRQKLQQKRRALEQQTATWEQTISRLRTEVNEYQEKIYKATSAQKSNCIYSELTEAATRKNAITNSFNSGAAAIEYIARLLSHSSLTTADFNLIRETVELNGSIGESVLSLISIAEEFFSGGK